MPNWVTTRSTIWSQIFVRPVKKWVILIVFVLSVRGKMFANWIGLDISLDSLPVPVPWLLDQPWPVWGLFVMVAILGLILESTVGLFEKIKGEYTAETNTLSGELDAIRNPIPHVVYSRATVLAVSGGMAPVGNFAPDFACHMFKNHLENPDLGAAAVNVRAVISVMDGTPSAIRPTTDGIWTGQSNMGWHHNNLDSVDLARNGKEQELRLVFKLSDEDCCYLYRGSLTPSVDCELPKGTHLLHVELTGDNLGSQDFWFSLVNDGAEGTLNIESAMNPNAALSSPLEPSE